MVQPLIKSRTEHAGSAIQTLRAPLFLQLINQIPEGNRQVVLDLGPARPETVALFSRFRCRMEIADLAPALPALNLAGEDDPLPDAVNRCLPAPRQEAVDVVLCWDLLNYLDRPALTALMETLALRCRPGTLVHFLLYYSEPQMPEKPGRMAPLADGQLQFTATGPGLIRAPRYSPEDLAHCMQDYTVVRAILLQNGMQEFLYRA